LYLPQDWSADAERRRKTKVPQDIEFETKPQIAIHQIEEAIKEGIHLGCILADAAYGNETAFRDRLTVLKLRYCVGVHSTTSIWVSGTEPLSPLPWKGNGRPPKRLRRDADHQPVSVKTFAMNLPKSSYTNVTWREGAKGAMCSRFAGARVIPAHNDYKKAADRRPPEWLLIEWPEGENEPTKYFFSTLPPTATLKQLVRTAKGRWRIERDYQELKDEIGLDHYEGRSWRGFHHHATLCIAAYAFLMKERLFSPSGTTDRQPQITVPGVPKGFRPRGAPDPA
jgi:SRSO17 transposase